MTKTTEKFNTKQLMAATALGATIMTGAMMGTKTHTAHADEISNPSQVQTTRKINKGNAYKVQAGDCLSKIAQKHGITLDQLRRLNNKYDDLIHVGDTLYVSGQIITTKTTPIQPVTQTPTNASPSVATSQVKHTSNATNATNNNVAQTSNASSSNVGQPTGGSVKDRVIRTAMQEGLSRGTAESMWNNIVMPESSGLPSAQNGRYRGLYQGDVSYNWPNGSVEEQTRGAIKYAKRYGGATPEQNVQNAVQFRNSNNWW